MAKPVSCWRMTARFATLGAMRCSKCPDRHEKLGFNGDFTFVIGRRLGLATPGRFIAGIAFTADGNGNLGAIIRDDK